jgi:hypothetical protein
MVRYRKDGAYTIEWFDDVDEARKRMFALGGDDAFNTVITRVKPYDSRG